MEKQRIIEEKKKIAEWALTLKVLPDQKWFMPFKIGSWATADVIAHFIFWDRFVIENRLKPFVFHEESPIYTVNVQQINETASKYAGEKTKREIINEFMDMRSELISMIERMPEEIINQPLPGRKVTWMEYFQELIEHDRNHQKQIEDHIKNVSRDDG